MTKSVKSCRFAALAVLTAFILSLFVFIVPSADVSALSINKKSLTVTAGYSATLKVSGTSATVKWSSSNKNVATVSSSGKVKGKKKGTCTISAKVNGATLSCNVTVVSGKLSVSASKVSIEEGDSKPVTVTLKSKSKAVKVKSSDKTVAKATWMQDSFVNDKANLRINGLKPGTAVISIYMSKDSSVKTTITVTVGSGFSNNTANASANLAVSMSDLSVKVNETSGFTLTSAEDGNLNFSMSDPSVADYSVGTFNNHMATVSIRGKKAGTTSLTITSRTDPNVYRRVTINVTGDTKASGYYQVYDDQSTSRFIQSNDKYYSFPDNSKGIYRFVLVPGTNEDTAQTNTAVSKATNTYQNYVVYSESPSVGSSERVLSFNCTINDVVVTNGTVSTQQRNVTRYVKVPNDYDSAKYEYAKACYTKTYEYGVLYSANPLTSTNPQFTKKAYDDKAKSYNVFKNGTSVTVYLVYPNFVTDPDTQYANALNTYGANSATNGYYQVFQTQQQALNARKASTDQILSFQTNNYQIYYILVPQKYEDAQVNTAKAQYVGYTYGVVYANQPNKLASTDVIYQWTKTVTLNGQSKLETHYVMYPSSSYVEQSNQVKAKDLGTSYAAYYTVTTSYPANTTTGEQVITWFNSKAGINNYMIVPTNYNILRVNDVKLNNGGQIDYYSPTTVYLSPSNMLSSTDYIYQTSILINGSYRTIYILLPSSINYDQTRLNNAVTTAQNSAY